MILSLSLHGFCLHAPPSVFMFQASKISTSTMDDQKPFPSYLNKQTVMQNHWQQHDADGPPKSNVYYTNGLRETPYLSPKAVKDLLWLQQINCLCRGCWLRERIRLDQRGIHRGERRMWGAWKVWVGLRKEDNQALLKLPKLSVYFLVLVHWS